MRVVPDAVVGGLCYSVFRCWEVFTGCIIYCVLKLIGVSSGRYVVLFSRFMRSVRGCVYIYVVVL